MHSYKYVALSISKLNQLELKDFPLSNVFLLLSKISLTGKTKALIDIFLKCKRFSKILKLYKNQ